jgi:tetratricopeptide (TPR) repeat protein
MYEHFLIYIRDWFFLGGELPQHTVEIPCFFMSKYPITQSQWKKIATLPKIKQNLSCNFDDNKEDNYPVSNISWEEAVEFCARLSKYTGRNYRLPTEAEWEYACRAGTQTPYNCGETLTTAFINFTQLNFFLRFFRKNNHSKKEVGSFQFSNKFGLCDLHGNVYEWCADSWHENYDSAPTDGSAWINNVEKKYQYTRIIRGGSWKSGFFACRSSHRTYEDKNTPREDIGFRVVCTIENPEIIDSYKKSIESVQIENDLDSAIELATELVKCQPKFIIWYEILGGCYCQTYPLKAIAHLNYAIENNPGQPNNYRWRGLAYQTLEKYQMALDDFTEAINIFNQLYLHENTELNPQRAINYYYRGYIHYLLNDFDQSLEDYTQAIIYNLNMILVFTFSVFLFIREY